MKGQVVHAYLCVCVCVFFVNLLEVWFLVLG